MAIRSVLFWHGRMAKGTRSMEVRSRKVPMAGSAVEPPGASFDDVCDLYLLSPIGRRVSEAGGEAVGVVARAFGGLRVAVPPTVGEAACSGAHGGFPSAPETPRPPPAVPSSPAMHTPPRVSVRQHPDHHPRPVRRIAPTVAFIRSVEHRQVRSRPPGRRHDAQGVPRAADRAHPASAAAFRSVGTGHCRAARERDSVPPLRGKGRQT